MSLSPGKTRAIALIRKETRQMVRDKSTLTLGIFLPILLLLLFGYGLSLDVTNVPVVLVRESASPVTRDIFTRLALSPYFSPEMVNSWAEAERMLHQGRTQAIVRRSLEEKSGGREHIQIIVNGRDSNQARIMQRYLEGAIALWAQGRQVSAQDSGHGPQGTLSKPGTAVAETRIWYNHALESRHFLVPGVTALIMTLIGALLTALVIAREWERGTYEALIATPVREGEFLLGKTVPYFLLGMVGLGLCLLAAAFIFGVPMRGSLVFIIGGSALYLLIALGIGLLVSAATKNQFLASQFVLIISFLPTLMLSGFIFDLKSAPRFVYYFAHLFPATWYVDLMQTLFLAGNIPEIIVKNGFVLLLFAIAALGLTRKKLRKTLE